MPTKPVPRLTSRPWLAGCSALAAAALVAGSRTVALGAAPFPRANHAEVFVVNNLISTITSYDSANTPSGSSLTTFYLGLDLPDSLAFDPSGNLWVANFGNDTVVEYPHQILDGRSPDPSVSISADARASIDGPTAIAFDPAGDLWVGNTLGNTLVEYRHSELRSGSPTPAVRISTDSEKSIDGPTAIAFDPAGRLWVANYNSNTVVAFASTELSTGSPRPTARIESDRAGDINSPAGLAFDPSGDLWVANNLADTLVEYQRRELTARSPTPAVSISAGARGALDGPAGLAFDPSGDLWVADYGDGRVEEFGPSQLDSTSSPAPRETISGPRTGLYTPEGTAIALPPPRR